MPLDRPSIQRSDFPTSRRGYDPGAVDAHLREVADAVEGMSRPAGQPMAAAASAQVQRIIEAAEATAEQLRTDAGEQAREHVERVSGAARELLGRIEAMQSELGGLMERLREDAGRLAGELEALEGEVEVLGPAGARAADAPAPPPAEPEPVTVVERIPDPGPAEPEPEPERAAAAGRPDDEEAARLVALDMALGGTPREETERYLAEHYALTDADGLLDDVYALAGS